MGNEKPPNPSDSEVDALFRRFLALRLDQRLQAYERIRDFLGASAALPARVDADERAEALRVLRAVVTELELADPGELSTREFDRAEAAVRGGWSSTRVRRAFGRWQFALDEVAGAGRPSADRRAAERAARKGVYRDREDYLAGVRMWLATNPLSRAADDYDLWRREHNARRAAGEPPVVSYSMLRKALPWSWRDIVRIASGEAAPADVEKRPLATDAPVLRGPHDLVSFGDIRKLLGRGITTTRTLTRDPDFPAPAYTQPRTPHARLWRRVDVEQFLAGRKPRKRKPNDLQDVYLDAREVAERLGLAVITVTTRSSPKVPFPAVRLAGLQLWLASDIEPA